MSEEREILSWPDFGVATRELAVQVHADAAQMRGTEVTGGPLVDVESWAKAGEGELQATEAAREGLEV